MPESRDSLKDLLLGAKPKLKGEEPPPELEDADDELTIANMDGRYATMRPANKALVRMHVILKDGKVFTFQNQFLDVRSTYDGKEFVFVYAGTKYYEVTVRGHGPRFWAIYDYVSTHRWPYLREATGNESRFSEADETVLTSIVVKDVTPKPED